MQSYYARRAASYERIYDRPERQAELRAIEGWIATPFAGRRGLEIACGTGWWTPHAAAQAADWLATDVNPETLAIARTKALPACVRFGRLDAYTLAGLDDGRYDAAFAGFWWSHVPRARLAPWLARLHARLEPGARVVFIDNRFVEGESTPITHVDADGDGWQTRTLDDGSVHQVLKNYPTRDEAFAAIGPRVHASTWTQHPHYWILDYRLA